MFAIELPMIMAKIMGNLFMKVSICSNGLKIRHIQGKNMGKNFMEVHIRPNA